MNSKDCATQKDMPNQDRMDAAHQELMRKGGGKMTDVHAKMGGRNMGGTEMVKPATK